MTKFRINFCINGETETNTLTFVTEDKIEKDMIDEIMNEIIKMPLRVFFNNMDSYYWLPMIKLKSGKWIEFDDVSSLCEDIKFRIV